MATAKERAEAAERIAHTYERLAEQCSLRARELLDQATLAESNARAYRRCAERARSEMPAADEEVTP